MTVFLNRANAKKLFNRNEHSYDSGKPEFKGERTIFFYDRENNVVDIHYNNSGISKIAINTGINRIEIYLHSTKHEDNYFGFTIFKNTGQIVIDNLSRYLITDFERYHFVFDKSNITMEYRWGTYKLKNKNQAQ